MSSRAHRLGTAAIVVGVGAVPVFLAVAGPAGAGVGNSTVVGTGPDHIYGTNALTGASATVSAGDIGRGNTQLTLEIEGVDAPAGTEFGAHLHVNPCGELPGAAGGHYLDATARGSLQHRELWLDFIVDDHGRGRAVATRSFEIPDRANRSVVIHVQGTNHESGAAGARLACIDIDG